MTTELSYGELQLGVVSSILGAVNTEAKILTLGCIPNEGITATGLHTELMVTLGAGVDAVARSPFTLRQDLDRTVARGLLDKTEVPDGKAIYTHTPVGRIAIGVGGFLLPAGYEHNVQLLPVMGQQVLDERRNSIATRLAVLFRLRTSGKGQWISVPSISKFVQEQTGTTHMAARRSISGLAEYGVVEKRQGRSAKNRVQTEVRLVQNPSKDYRAFIATYFDAVGAISTLDTDTLTDSSKRLQDFLAYAAKSGTLGMILKRAQLTSKHFGVSRPKKPKV